MEGKLNQLPEITDFEAAYIIAQYAHENGFRAGTGKAFYQWILGMLDVLGLSNTAGLPQFLPAPGAILTATDAKQWTFLFPNEDGTAATYNKITSGTITVPGDSIAIAQFDGTDYNTVRFIKMPKNPLADDYGTSVDDGATQRLVTALRDRVNEVEEKVGKAEDWEDGTYTSEQTAVKDGVLYRVKKNVASTTGEPGVSEDWEPLGTPINVYATKAVKAYYEVSKLNDKFINLSQDYILSKWIEPTDLGKIFETAVEDSTNTFGNILQPIVIENGKTYYVRVNSGNNFIDELNRTFILLDANRVIIDRITPSASSNSITINNENAVFLAFQYPKGYNQSIIISDSSTHITDDRVDFRDKTLAFLDDVNNLEGKIPLFDPAKIGGYDKDAQVRDANGIAYVSLKNWNTSNLSVDVDWLQIGGGYSVTSAVKSYYEVSKLNDKFINLSQDYILSKWIEPTDLGKIFETAVEDSTNTFGNILQPIVIENGKTYYVRTKAGANFTGDVNRVFILMDVNRVIIDRITPSTTDYSTTISNNKAVFLSFQYPAGYGKNIIISDSPTPINYDRVKYRGKTLSFLEDVNNWSGKKVVTYGDSITQYGFWQKLTFDYFNVNNIVNYGLSGSKVTNIGNGGYNGGWWVNSVTGYVYGSVNSYPNKDDSWENAVHVYSNYSNQSRVDCIPTDADLVIVMGGTNDTGVAAPIGDVNFDTSTNTFNEGTIKGAMCETIRKIQIRCPNAVIVTATPLSGLGSYSDNVNYNQATKINEVAQAIKEASFYMSTPCIDIFGQCGINISNSANYLQADKIHPTYGALTDRGSVMIARVMVAGLKNILPKTVFLDIN